ncbi:MAG TPA: thiol-activated cytolysin family protein [Chitinophagaceae bacterium]|nr:thiol-activated cytolysin family protein [Chitinophagaceae bacterium]
MKKSFIILLIPVTLCSASFAQVMQKKMNAATTVKPIAQPVNKTVTQQPSQPVTAREIKTPIVASNLIYLNKKDNGSRYKLSARINPNLNNYIKKQYEFTKDLHYPDGSLIHLRLTKNPAITSQDPALKVAAKQTGQDEDAGFDCITSNVSLTATSTDFLNNDYSRQTSHIYPGAIYTYEHLYDGSFQEETNNRNPIIIGSSSPNMSSPTFEEVENPNQNNIHNALAKLYSRFHGDAANESMAYQVFESANTSDLSIKVGAGGSGYGFTFSNVFNTAEQDKHVYLTVDARKSLFTMSVALPDSGYFKTPVNSESPLVIMGSVSYGVRVLANMEFTFLTKSDADNFKAQYSGFGFNANVSLDYLSKSTAASTTVNAYIIGGPSSGATVSFDKQDLQQKIQSIFSSATYQNAQPISYELYDMNGVVIGQQSATDQFTERNCVPKDIPTNLQNPQVSIISGDDGKDKDTHYTLELFNSNNQQAAMYVNNSNSDEYAKYESNAVEMTAGTPTGKIINKGSLPLPEMRPPVLADFSNGGRIHISITPNGHDTWNIQNFKVTLTFQGQKPHTIQWSSKTLSQDTRDKDLLFDSGFNAIQ